MTTPTHTVHLVRVLDGANFDVPMTSYRWAMSYEKAYAWGLEMRDKLRAKRREDGETDELFIRAIHMEMKEVEPC